MTTPYQSRQLSILDKAGVIASLVFLIPFVVGWTLLTSPFHRLNKHRLLTRVIGDRIFYFIAAYLNVQQRSWLLGDTLDVYTAYMRRQNLPLVTDKLGDSGGRLLWLGEKRTDRVILYFHGGGYLTPATFLTLPFWNYILRKVECKGKKTGFAMLQYTLMDATPFPAQLKQAVLAVQHLLSMGIHPQNIHLSGDSAGGNLILKLFSHILHPILGVPELTLPSPFSRAYLMSPWVSLTDQTGSMITNTGSDVVDNQTFTSWGRTILDHDTIPDHYRPYLEPLDAPDGWFEELSNVVDRVLITAGDAECLRDQIVRFADRLEREHGKGKGRVRFVLQTHGVHIDPYLDFVWPWHPKVIGNLTSEIVDFFAS